MSQVQIINASPLKVGHQTNKIIIPNTNTEIATIVTPESSHQTVKTATITEAIPGTSTDTVHRSPLKKRPYRADMLDDQPENKPAQSSNGDELSYQQQQVVIVDTTVGHSGPGDIQSVNMADVASTVYEAYIDTVQFTFNNTMSMRQNLSDKFVASESSTTLDEIQATTCWKAYEARFNEAIADVVNFAKRIPGFTALETDDQIILIKGGSFEVSAL